MTKKELLEENRMLKFKIKYLEHTLNWKDDLVRELMSEISTEEEYQEIPKYLLSQDEFKELYELNIKSRKKFNTPRWIE